MTPWDVGCRWHVEQVTAPDLPLVVATVRDDHLRGVNGSTEDTYIESLIKTSTRMAERRTKRAHMPRTFAQVMSRFPRWQIELARPPLIEVLSVVYLDEDGAQQTLSAATYQVSGSRDVNRRFWLAPAPDETWPATEAERLDAVTVTYRAGYVTESPETADIPEDILHGQLLVIGELYKQRSDSVIGFGVSINPALVRARDLWDQHRVY